MSEKKYKVIVIAHQLKNKMVAKANEIVSESQLLNNAQELVDKGFIELYEDDSDDTPVDSGKKLNSKPPVKKTDAEKLQDAMDEHKSAVDALNLLPVDADVKLLTAANKKVDSASAKIEKLGGTVPVETPVEDTRTEEEKIDDLKQQYAESLNVSTDGMNPKEVAATVNKTSQLAGQLLDLGFDVNNTNSQE